MEALPALQPTQGGGLTHACATPYVHRKKSFSILLTKLSLGGNNDAIYKLFQPRESLVSNIPAGDGNIETFSLRYVAQTLY